MQYAAIVGALVRPNTGFFLHQANLQPWVQPLHLEGRAHPDDPTSNHDHIHTEDRYFSITLYTKRARPDDIKGSHHPKQRISRYPDAGGLPKNGRIKLK